MDEDEDEEEDEEEKEEEKEEEEVEVADRGEAKSPTPPSVSFSSSLWRMPDSSGEMSSPGLAVTVTVAVPLGGRVAAHPHTRRSPMRTS